MHTMLSLLTQKPIKMMNKSHTFTALIRVSEEQFILGVEQGKYSLQRDFKIMGCDV